MRRKCVFGVLGCVAVLLSLLLLPVPALWTWRPWLFSVQKGIDVNSGDVVQWTYVCGLQVKERIQMSRFSQELRRVGVSTPTVRKWKPTFRTELGSSRWFGSEDSYLVTQCDLILKTLDLHRTPDTERCVILAEALSVLQRGEVGQMRDFIEQLLKTGYKHGTQAFTDLRQGNRGFGGLPFGFVGSRPILKKTGVHTSVIHNSA